MSLRKKAPKKAARNAEIIIPDKLYFRIGEVAELVPSAGLRASFLGNRISATQAHKEQHRPAHVSQARCGIGGADQETAL